MLLIWGYFREWKMSVAAIVALAHDLVITVGVYALSGFEVTPATVTGILTILGFSLYDTVVVFDKVRENTKVLNAHPPDVRRGGQPRGQPDAGPVDQHLDRRAAARSAPCSTSAPSTSARAALKDLALALFVGMAAGAYSSIFIATPLLVQLKEREPGVKAGDAGPASTAPRREVDPFANVPAFSEDMPIHDEPGIEDEPPGRRTATAGGRRRATATVPCRRERPGRFTAGERAGVVAPGVGHHLRRATAAVPASRARSAARSTVATRMGWRDRR